MTNDDRIDRLAAFVRKIAKLRLSNEDPVFDPWNKGYRDAQEDLGEDAYAVLEECGLA